MNVTPAESRTKHTVRVEDDVLVRGLGRFVDDVHPADEAHAAFVRSPHAFARIRSVDVNAALAAPGVLAVLTAKDMDAAGVRSMGGHPPLPGRGGTKLFVPHRPSLAGDRVLHVGQAVAMVVAATRREALEAAELIAVDYEELTPLVDALEFDPPRRAADLAGGAGQCRARLDGSGGGRRGQCARGRAALPVGEARRQGRPHDRAHQRRLNGDARCDRRLRRGERHLHAAHVLARNGADAR